MDKVQKIREEVEKRYEYFREKAFNSHSIESEIRMSECQHLLLMLAQEEPVSKDLEDAAYKFVMDNFGNLQEPLYKFDQRCFKAGAQWQKEQIEEALLSEVLPIFMHGGEADEVVAKLDEVLSQKKQNYE